MDVEVPFRPGVIACRVDLFGVAAGSPVSPALGGPFGCNRVCSLSGNIKQWSQHDADKAFSN